MIGSNKRSVQILVEKCYQFGVKHIVISPGSRNAPLILSFANNNEFTCYSIPDERCAGFCALGMARELQQPVAVICTSGTAVLNLSPAIAEAYYQEIPLIAITADRPPEWIDQEDGQTIRQKDIFQNYVKYSVSLPIDDHPKYIDTKKLIDSALINAIERPKAPVHINVPLDNPLYETVNYEFVKQHLVIKQANNKFDSKALVNEWNKADKILIVAGFMYPDKKINQEINQLIEQKNILVIAGNTSNLHNKEIISTPDLFLNSITYCQKQKLKPDLLITIGNAVVSKSLKQFLRTHKPKCHIDIDLNATKADTYRLLSCKIIAPYLQLLQHINKNCNAKNINYKQFATDLSKQTISRFNEELKDMPFCDLSMYNCFFDKIHKPVNLHLSNSTPVRYAEMFPTKANIKYFANRGTSGIDGCTSTALGSAIVGERDTFLITGDVAFVYDSNALWNKYLPNNLKIIVINNGGGNIFRILDGSNNSNKLPFFETPHNCNVKKLCESFGINYLSANNSKTLNSNLDILIDSEQTAVLEVITSNIISSEMYKRVLKINLPDKLS